MQKRHVQSYGIKQVVYLLWKQALARWFEVKIEKCVYGENKMLHWLGPPLGFEHQRLCVPYAPPSAGEGNDSEMFFLTEKFQAMEKENEVQTANEVKVWAVITQLNLPTHICSSMFINMIILDQWIKNMCNWTWSGEKQVLLGIEWISGITETQTN